jgi:Mg2+ and Co2+ transporter CorA
VVRGHLLLTNCLEDEVTRQNIELALKEDKLLWLDLQDTDDETLALLREVFKLHPLAVEDVKEFSQRPKVEDYDDFVSLVAYGARGLDEPLIEVHCFYAGFFGQNFAWLVNRIGSLAAFVGIGIGTEVVAVIALVTLFRTRGWMGKSNRS